MLKLFSSRDKRSKLNQGLPPGERITNFFEEEIEPMLKEHGFKYIKSRFLLKRKIGQFTQEIIISKNKWNQTDTVCSFWLVFSVYAETYNDWHKENYGTFPINNCVVSFYHNHLKNWKTTFKLDKYDLCKHDNLKVSKEIRLNLKNLVLPLFDNYSDYKNSADTLMRNKEYWWGTKIFDYYLISGEPNKAKESLKMTKGYFSNQIHTSKETLKEIEVREALI